MGNLRTDEIDSLEQLSRLVKLVDASQPKRRPNLWLLPALFLTTLIILSILLFGHVSETEIELDVTASDVSFAVPDQQVLTTLMQLTRLGIDGLNEIRIPRSQEEGSHTINSADNGRATLHVLITPEKKNRKPIAFFRYSPLEPGYEFIPLKSQINMDCLLWDHPLTFGLRFSAEFKCLFRPQVYDV